MANMRLSFNLQTMKLEFLQARMYLVIFEKQLWQFHLLFRYGHNPSSVPFMPRKFLSVSPMSNVLALKDVDQKNYHNRKEGN